MLFHLSTVELRVAICRDGRHPVVIASAISTECLPFKVWKTRYWHVPIVFARLANNINALVNVLFSDSDPFKEGASRSECFGTVATISPSWWTWRFPRMYYNIFQGGFFIPNSASNSFMSLIYYNIFNESACAPHDLSIDDQGGQSPSASFVERYLWPRSMGERSSQIYALQWRRPRPTHLQ